MSVAVSLFYGSFNVSRKEPTNLSGVEADEWGGLVLIWLPISLKTHGAGGWGYSHLQIGFHVILLFSLWHLSLLLLLINHPSGLRPSISPPAGGGGRWSLGCTEWGQEVGVSFYRPLNLQLGRTCQVSSSATPPCLSQSLVPAIPVSCQESAA